MPEISGIHCSSLRRYRSLISGGGDDVNIQIAADKTPQAKEVSGDKRTRKSESVFQDLKGRILTGQLRQDSPMTEQSLAKDYACSQSTIREALMLLQEGGLVVRKGYQGTFVTDPSVSEALLLLRLRVNLETTGIMEAVKKITPCKLAELRDLDRQFVEARSQRDVFTCSEIDRDFHLQIFKLAGMPALDSMLVRTLMMLQRIMLPNPRPDEAWTHPDIVQHDLLLDALEASNDKAAVKALKDHVFSSATLLAKQYYGRDPVALRALCEREPDQVVLEGL